MLVVLPGCGPRPPPNDRPVAPSESLAPSVAGTTWVGTDSRGDYYEYHFQPDGALHYRSPTGFWKNGTWRQDRNAIYMETNNGYSERQGLIIGTRMEGKAWNVEGRKWTWVAERDHCLAQPPIAADSSTRRC